MKCEQGSDGTILFWCPGCDEAHGIDPKRWKFDGNFAAPTISPSILVRGQIPPTDEECAKIMEGWKFEKVWRICHSFVTAGRIQFLGDSTHALAGQTVDLPDWQSV